MGSETEVTPLKRTVAARVPSDIADRIAQEAKDEDRTVSNVLSRIITAHYERQDGDNLAQAA